MIAAALALLLTQADGGALSFADVKAGDDLVYAIDSKRKLELRACAASADAVQANPSPSAPTSCSSTAGAPLENIAI